MTNTSLGRDLASRIAALRPDDLPAAAVDLVKLFTLDTLGVIGGAARAPGMRQLVDTLTEWEPAGRATLLLSGRTASPAAAALANGAAAHSLDFDDQHDDARIHAFCVVLPAALAAAEANGGASGKEFTLAVAVGVEVFCRLGLVCHNSLGKGWHPTTTLGCFAAAAAASKLMGLDAEQTLHALGLAFVQMGGTTQFIADGALAKRMGPGFAARAGVTAAQLARGGLTGPWRFLEGEAGLFNLHERGEVRPALLLDGWGTTWRLLELSMKPYPCCRCVHTVIQLALDLRAEGVRPEQVVSGEIGLGRVNRQIVGAPFDRNAANPVVHAQFNAAYAFAAALVDGQVGIGTFTPGRITADDVAWAARLSTVEAADIVPTAVPPARVRLVLQDGTVLSRARELMKGSPEAPMTPQEVLAKFRACLAWGLDADGAAADRLHDQVMRLDTPDDARALITAFRALPPVRAAA